MYRYEFTLVKYHSAEWGSLVEQGWMTHSLELNGEAKMIRRVKI